MTRYLDADSCALIADALATLSPDDGKSIVAAAVLEAFFRDRATPLAGVILTVPGESN